MDGAIGRAVGGVFYPLKARGVVFGIYVAIVVVVGMVVSNGGAIGRVFF